MATRSIVGRFLILAVLIVAVGVAAQAALILTDNGRKPVTTASAAPATTSGGADTSQAPGEDPVRVVYPGPLGEMPVQKPKLVEAASDLPLNGPAPQPNAKLAQAMSAAAQPPAAPALPSATQPAAPSAADPAPAPLALPPSAQADAVSHSVPTTPAPAGVEVASLGGGVPQADPAASGSVNINTASVDALNHLGGGHIGQSIAKHRPYGSVEDLVKKRVLRRSVYDQIKSQLAAQ